MNFPKLFYNACSFITAGFTVLSFLSAIFGSIVSLIMGIIMVIPTSDIYFLELGIILIVFSLTLMPLVSALGFWGCMELTSCCVELENNSVV
jgi:hypothetical protein